MSLTVLAPWADGRGRDMAQTSLMDGAADLVAVPTEERAP
jgi:hypothetical protein